MQQPKLRIVFSNPRDDPIITFLDSHRWSPPQHTLHLAVISDVNTLVGFARLLLDCDRDLPPKLLAQQGRGLSQGERSLGAAPHIKDLAGNPIQMLHLCFQQPANVFDEQDIPDLFSSPTDVLQRESKVERDGPPRNPTLLGFSKLTFSSDNTETVDHRFYPKGVGVLLASKVGHDLAEAVDAALSAVNAELF